MYTPDTKSTKDLCKVRKYCSGVVEAEGRCVPLTLLTIITSIVSN